MRKRWILPLALVLLWLCVIWSNSMKPAVVSAEMSGGVLTWLVETFPFLSWVGEHLLRKLAHFSEFGLLGMLLTWLFLELRTAGYHRFTMPLLCAMLSAAVDETIQLFPEGRSSEVVDVWIDTAGAAVGILVLLIGYALLIKWKGKQHK